MARRKHTPEQVINNLRQAEVAISEGSTVAEANRKIRVTEQTFYRWRAERPAPIACTSCYVSPTSDGIGRGGGMAFSTRECSSSSAPPTKSSTTHRKTAPACSWSRSSRRSPARSRSGGHLPHPSPIFASQADNVVRFD